MTLRSQAQFVGRERELGALGAAVESAHSGLPELVFIEGEAGVGKTRLLSEAIGRYRPEGALVIQAHGVDLMGDQLPYGIIAETVRSSLRASDGRLGKEFPESAQVVVEAFTAAKPGAALERLHRVDLFGGFSALFETLGREDFVWLVVEDLHWADESSLELLGYLARVVTAGRFLTTYTVRTGSGTPSRAFTRFATDTGRAPNASTIALRPLDRRGAEEMVTHLMGQRPGGRLMDRLLALSNGNPLLTEELVYGGLTVDGLVPASPRAAMVARVERLSDDCSSLIGIASLAYGPFSIEHLRRLLPFDDDQLDAVLVEAIGQGVIEPEPASEGYRFHHALLQEAVAGSLPPTSVRGAHRAWAEVRDSGSASEADPWFATVAAAHHWVRSGDTERGFDACVNAVSLATTLHAPSERAPLLVEALSLWDRVPDPELRSGWTRDLLAKETIRFAHFAGDWVGALALLEAELRHPDSDRDAVRRATLELSRQGTLEQLGRSNAADFELRVPELADLMFNAPDGPWLANGCLEASWRVGRMDNREQSEALLERAASAALAQDDAMAQLNAGQTLADHLIAYGRCDDALAKVRDLLALTTERIPERVSDVEAQLSWILCFLGDLGSGLAVAERAMRRIPSSSMSSRLFAYVAQNLAYVLIELGRWDEADTWLAEARIAYPQGWTAIEVQAEAARLASYRGDIKAADDLAQTLWHAVPSDERGPLTTIGRGGIARIAKATVARYRGDLTLVRTLLAPVWAIPDLEEETGSAWRAVLLAVAAEADMATRATGRGRVHRTRTTESDQHIATLQAVAGVLYTPGRLGATWPLHFAADVARYQHEDSAEMWRAVAEAWERVGVPHDRAWALLHAAECHLAKDERDMAQAAIAEARELATRLGAEPLTQALRGCADRGRLPMDVSDSDNNSTSDRRLHGLTPREVDVLKLMAKGHTNGQIAGQLFISHKTVSVHVSNILTKLQVGSRTEAAAAAIRNGFADQ